MVAHGSLTLRGGAETDQRSGTAGEDDGIDRSARPLAAEPAGRAAPDPGPAGLSFSPKRAAFWVVSALIALFASAMQSLSAVRDLERYQVDTATWEPWTWELTSAVALLTVLPGLVRLVAWRPWSAGRRSSTAVLYAVAAVVFSALHAALMVALRQIVYALAGSRYVFGSVGREFVYELRKDAVTFLLLIIVLNLLQEVERRLTAPVLAPREPVDPAVAVAVTPAAAAPPDARITIRDGAKEVRLDRETLVALRAAGNYVEVFLANDRPLMLRATLADAESRLGDAGFVRVHRSWLIALHHVRALTPTGAGDYRAELTANLTAPVSRRYKDALGRLREAPGAATDR